MMGRNIKMAAVAFTAIITLTGCGTKLYDMTDEEQGLIANYSAYVVAKHNIYQQDGMTNATEKRGDMEDADDTEKVDEASPDNSLSQDNKTSEAGNDKSSNSQKEPSATQEKKVSLAEATGYGSLEITYDGVNESDRACGRLAGLRAGQPAGTVVPAFRRQEPHRTLCGHGRMPQLGS